MNPQLLYPGGGEAHRPPAPLGLPENALQGWGWGPLGHQAGLKTFTFCPAAHLLSGAVPGTERSPTTHLSEAFCSLPLPSNPESWGLFASHSSGDSAEVAGPGSGPLSA